MRIHRISILFLAVLVVGQLPMSSPGLRTAQADTQAADPFRDVDQYLSRLTPFGFSGVATVVKDGKVRLQKGYGLANRDRNLPFGADSVVNLGSITKQFTAAAILKLEMQGKLKVTDPMSKHLPGVPKDKEAITLHHLLTHSAGLRGDYGPTDYEAVERDEYLKRVFSEPLEAEPGATYAYSNAGYSLLAAIVEIVSNESYESYLRKNVLEPAGMTQTGYKLPVWNQDRVAHGYIDGNDWGTVVDKPMAADGPYWNLRGNGGLQTTMADMIAWHKALDGTAVLSEAARTKMFTPHIAEGPEAQSHYGYGWAIFKTPRNTRLIAHNGGNGIFAADFLRYVDEGTMIFIASNSAELPAIQISQNVARILFGVETPMPPETAAMDDSAAKFAGAYASESGARVSIRRQGNGFAVEGEGQTALNAISGISADSPRISALNERAAGMVAGSRKGDYQPLADAFGGQMPLADIRENESAMWKRMEANNGAFRSFAVVGTQAGGPALFTTVKLEFERGVRYLRFRWEGPELVGIRVVDAGSARNFLPAKPSRFVALDPRTGATVWLAFDVDGAGATTLKIGDGAGALLLKRVP